MKKRGMLIMVHDGFVRIAAATPKIVVADVYSNVAQIEQEIKLAYEKGCAAVVLPALSVTGSTCADLFWSHTLIMNCEKALQILIKKTQAMDILCVLGAPVKVGSKLLNCAVVFFKGKILGLVPKSYSNGEFRSPELRYFSELSFEEDGSLVSFCGSKVLIGENILFACDEIPDFIVGVELCNQFWGVSLKSEQHAVSTATLIMNLSADFEEVSKFESRKDLVRIHSGKIMSGYVSANCGIGESTTDFVFAGHNLIAENGYILAESELFSSGVLTADVDLQRIVQERVRTHFGHNNYHSCNRNSSVKPEGKTTIVPFSYNDLTRLEILSDRIEPQSPFIPEDEDLCRARCEEILTMQSVALLTRLQHIHSQNVVLGVSGGLDSTLALIVTARAFDRMGWDHRGIKAISMPCFGTTNRTKNNARYISQGMDADFSEISIQKAILQHFKDIEQDINRTDATYENAQARERTQVLMDRANQCGGLVVGTGDLSELALGFATYNGDHMSMYSINASVPKTLVRILVQYVASTSGPTLKALLTDVVKTPVSPELLPARNGQITQVTEDLVGPYALHDYFLYYMYKFGFSPNKIYHMASASFAGEYEPVTIKKWLRTFYARFFSQQFKRSCSPDGPKIGSVGLSPRGDLVMPSDAKVRIWMDELDSI